jgi:hypothetical protein
MAAPTHTAALTQVAIGGIPLPRGFSSLLIFNRLPTARFYCQKIKPSKIDGGAPIQQSTMLNLTVHTFLPQALIKHDDETVTATYDPTLKSQILASLVNQNGSVTHFDSDGSYEDFYGFMYEMDFGELEIGTLPLCTFKVCKSNWDSVNHLEVAPVYTNVSGT